MLHLGPGRAIYDAPVAEARPEAARKQQASGGGMPSSGSCSEVAQCYLSGGGTVTKTGCTFFRCRREGVYLVGQMHGGFDLSPRYLKVSLHHPSEPGGRKSESKNKLIACSGSVGALAVSGRLA